MDNGSCPVPLGKAKTCEEAVRLKRLEYTLQFLSLSILYYDYVLTLPDEIKHIWLRPWRLSTVFYFFCRYSLVANLIYLLAISEDVTGFDCHTGYKICGVLSTLGHIGIISVWTLRTCAVYHNNRYMFAFFFVLGLAVVVLLSVRVPYLRCSGMIDMSKVLGANAAIMLFIEISSFLLATYQVWKSSREIKKKSAVSKLISLNKIILAQGTLYIGGVSILSVGVLILNFKAKSGFVSRLLNGLKLPLSGFLTARFMLRLRAWNGPKDPYNLNDGRSFTAQTLPPIQFTENPAAAASLAASSILSEFRGDIGSRRSGTRSSRYDVDDDSDLDDLMEDEDADTLSSLPNTGTFNDDLTSAGLSSAGLKQRRQGAVPDLEEGVPSPRQDACGSGRSTPRAPVASSSRTQL